MKLYIYWLLKKVQNAFTEDLFRSELMVGFKPQQTSFIS